MRRYGVRFFDSAFKETRAFSITTKAIKSNKLASLPQTNPELQNSLNEMREKIASQTEDGKISSNRKLLNTGKLKEVLDQAEESQRDFSAYG